MTIDTDPAGEPVGGSASMSASKAHRTHAPSTDRPPGLGATRTRVLGSLQDMGDQVTANDLGERLGVHVNTARFHLEALVEAGLAERAHETRASPGRPRVRYTAVGGVPRASERGYRLLAEILTTHLATQFAEPEAVAGAAGAAYGRAISSSLSTEPDGGDPSDEGDVDTVLALLETMGFPATAASGAAAGRIDVTGCPFLELARNHVPVVCSVHRGLMDGVLEGLGSGVRVRRLDPLVEPGRCVAHLAEPTPNAPGPARPFTGAR